MTARTEFSQLDQRATSEARDRARRFAEAVYDNDPVPITQLAAIVRNEVAQLAGAAELVGVDAELWEQYQPVPAEGTPEPTPDEQANQFQRFQESLASEEALEGFRRALDKTIAPLEQWGLLAIQPQNANAEQIVVRPLKKEGVEQFVPVRDVLIDNVRNELDQSLRRLMPNQDLARHIFARLNADLPMTLKLNEAATREHADSKAEAALEVYRIFKPGDLLAKAGEPLSDAQVALLELDYESRLKQRGPLMRIARGAGVIWLYSAMLALAGLGVYRADPAALVELRQYIILLITLVASLAVMVFSATPAWRIELLPLLLLGMTLAIAYRHQSAMIVAAAAASIAAVGLGWSLGETVAAIAPTAAGIALLDSVRHRSKLLMVGLGAGLVAVITTLAVGSVEGQPMWATLKPVAIVSAAWCVVAGSLVTLLLTPIERLFHVQTDLSLIELGDPSKPLLQELVRRAPGTYNHSITVASIAEAAAESIGARGLLVRVGAYYHDIGKMLKPGYFIENQGQGGNQHDQLVPAMSTLVIIAHVKDGADLARQNHLPQCLIDFIEQHHGTTLVEYFYRQAQKKSQDDANPSEVDENRFRYPGPKPQSKEAGVLMLSDAVESASRALREPTPSRIENLVEELTRKRLDDGQFDECGLTLRELHTVCESLIKSLTAVYHGRVKYPDQETA